MNPDQQLGALIARVDALEKMDERIDGKLTVLQEDISEIKVTRAPTRQQHRPPRR